MRPQPRVLGRKHTRWSPRAHREPARKQAVALLNHLVRAGVGYVRLVDRTSRITVDAFKTYAETVVKAFAGSTIPPGYLLCDGSAVSRTSYSALFAAISNVVPTGAATRWPHSDAGSVKPSGLPCRTTIWLPTLT